MSERAYLVLVKVGGSAITDKSGEEVLKEEELCESARQVMAKLRFPPIAGVLASTSQCFPDEAPFAL